MDSLPTRYTGALGINEYHPTCNTRHDNMRRAKSLSRPERQRPRQGILRSTDDYGSNGNRQYQRFNDNNIYQQNHDYQDGRRIDQPMSQELTQQLAQYRKDHIRQQLSKHNTDLTIDSNTNHCRSKGKLRDKKERGASHNNVRVGWWAWCAFLATCCFPSYCIRLCFGKTNSMMRQAWREKITLVYIIIFLCLILAYLTYGLARTICPEKGDYYPHSIILETGQRVAFDNTNNGMYSIFGQLYPTDIVQAFFQQHNMNLTTDYGSLDLGVLFDGDLYGDCTSFFPANFNRSTVDPCRLENPYGGSFLATNDGSCLSLADLQSIYNPIDTVNFDWDEFMDPIPNSNMLLFGNYVVDMTRYFNNYPAGTFGAQIEKVLHQFVNRDASYAALYYKSGHQAMNCAIALFGVGVMQTDSGGCIASNIIMNILFTIIISMIVVRYLMAILFQWIISPRLVKSGGRSNWLAWRSVQGGNADPKNHFRNSYNNNTLRNQPSSPKSISSKYEIINSPTLPSAVYSMTRYPTPRTSSAFNSPASLSRPSSSVFANTPSSTSVATAGGYCDLLTGKGNHPTPYQYTTQSQLRSASSLTIASPSSAFVTSPSQDSSEIIRTELYTCMMVTCYSEGEEGLRTTMDSLAETTYSSKHKIFFVIADGLIVGAGETNPTPDILVNMMDIDSSMADPPLVSYLAVADGEKQLNMAKVYAGHYNQIPCITIVKCGGTPEEQSSSKPGNRGKRDSQLILMSFFQRVLFHDRLSELDYELFWKMTKLMNGVTPDKFELVLMVDADTKVLPDALSYMVAAMANDITIMGLCGETRIANKSPSWVTAIQVFEYYISHHYAKAFESLFGIVTCLPGCFSMYRIKAPKNGAWVPILANPDVVLEYNQNKVTTLHEKNLLLLGEDRFLSTVMLRTFPHRQMMFVPQAICKTVVPDEFMVLLSQRRRWINSTVHNLMELVLVSDLCGIACLSMQFSIMIDLVGTLVLPCAVLMTIYLVVTAIVSGHPQWQSIGLLAAILGLPGALIVITTRKLVYIGWMIIYICAIPIWNFILPVYSFWHFDDFSWGATRVVLGDEKGKNDTGHDDASGVFDSTRLVMRKWQDWEVMRTRNQKLLLYINATSGNDRRPCLSHATLSSAPLDQTAHATAFSMPTPHGYPSPSP